MIDWQQAEVQAIFTGAKDNGLIQRTDTRNLLTDLASGYRTYVEGRVLAPKVLWDSLANCKVLGREHCEANGLARCKARKLKIELLHKTQFLMNRLNDPDDLCTDLVGNGTNDKLLNEPQLCERVKSMYALTSRFKAPWRLVSEMLANYRSGDVLALCGLSGTGKTNVAMQLSYFAGYKTLYFGVDMSVHGFGDRILKTAWYRDNLGQMYPYGERIQCDLEIERKAKDGSLHISDGLRTYDCDSMTLEQIEFMARNEMQTFPAEFLVIDYAGRIESEKESRDQWRDDQIIARSIKGMAKRLDIKIIALSQFSGKAEKYKKPESSWMQGSKEFISAADVVISLWQDKKQDGSADYSHLNISDDIKNRDSGTHGDARLEAYGLWLYEEKQ